MAVAGVGSTVGYWVIRDLMFDQVDRTLLRLASLEASFAAAPQDTTVRFHHAVLLNAGSASQAILPRYGQVWSVEGKPIIRTSNLNGSDLPLDEDVRRRVVGSQQPEIFGFQWREESYRAVVYPLGLVGPQHELHLLEVALSTAQAREVLRGFRTLLAFLALLGVAVSFLLGWWLAGSAIRPVMSIIDQAEAIEMTGGGHKIEAQVHTAEMGRLISVLDSMLARIDAAFAAQRSFIGDVGHQIRTPLTVLRGDIEVALRRQRSQEQYQTILAESLVDLKEVSGLADDLIMLARGDSGVLSPHLERVATAEVLEKVAEKYRGAAQETGLDIIVEAQPQVVLADGKMLTRAIGNLVDNAIKYGKSGTTVRLRSSPGQGGQVILTVADDGGGVLAEDYGELFKRFVRGRSHRDHVPGAGLGLSITKAIVESHGGEVVYRDGAGSGAIFEIVLPAAGGEATDCGPAKLGPRP
jgi:two-component system OmpR family sensor kinase